MLVFLILGFIFTAYFSDTGGITVFLFWPFTSFFLNCNYIYFVIELSTVKEEACLQRKCPFFPIKQGYLEMFFPVSFLLTSFGLSIFFTFRRFHFLNKDPAASNTFFFFFTNLVVSSKYSIVLFFRLFFFYHINERFQWIFNYCSLDNLKINIILKLNLF